MPSDYEQICKDNIRRRGEEFDDIGRLISEQLYSDRTHFIYELLQNAEDALGRCKRNDPESGLPTNVKFLLYKDRLEFRHFGENFNIEDVKGISDVLKGTKSEDNTQIGKFGIGFKSVYAFTSTPEIHSGVEHFIIERYIRPRNAENIPQMARGETAFIFPFNHKDLSKERAFQLIEEKLKNIGSRILLFLRNITEVEWIIEGQDDGIYLKESKQHNQFTQKVTVIGQNGNKDDDEEEWLVFRRKIEAGNSSFDSFVEIAFRLIIDGKLEKEIIRKIESSPLIVYFPTKLETRLGFFVHGPYDTTASRSDIENNEWNRRLITETADLLTETVMPWFKENELLTTSFLEALPIRLDAFPQESLFRPIYEKVRVTLRNLDFLPTPEGKYTAGKRAVLARAEGLVNLMSSEQLSDLLNESQHLEWLTTDITETKKDIHRYLVGCKPTYYNTWEEVEPLIVAEIRPGDIIEKLTPEFLEAQSITWLLKFYAFWEKPKQIDKLKSQPVVRLEEGCHVVPFKRDGSPNAFLPPDNDTTFPVVSREICKDENAFKFFKKLGLKEPDLVDEVLKKVLPKYQNEDAVITKEEHQQDIIAIEKAYGTDSQEKKSRLQERLRETPFVRAEIQGDGEPIYRRPDELYFRSDELRLYFSGNSTIGFVNVEYAESVRQMFMKLGVTDCVRVSRNRKNWQGYVVLKDWHGCHERALDGFDPYIDVVGLENALKHPTKEKSLFIWNKIVRENADCIRGVIESCSRQTYENCKQKERTSDFGRLLIENAWLPHFDESLKRPCELTLDNLPKSFFRDENLAQQLEMKTDVVAKLAEKAGVSEETLVRAKKLEKCSPELQFKIDQLLRSDPSGKKPAFPERASSNPERRHKKIEEQIVDAPQKIYEKRSRSVRTTGGLIDSSLWLRNHYKNENGQMVCQVCKEEMPFLKRDGEPYFETVEALANSHFTREHEAQFLALCPLCAAMYKEFIKNDEEAMESLKDAIQNSEGEEIPVQLGSLATTVRFVETHSDDIKSIIDVMD